LRQKYFGKGQPIIARGFINDSCHWGLDFLRQHLGHQTFPVRHYGRKRYQQDIRKWEDMGSGVPVQQLTFNAYADMIASGEAHQNDLYLARCSLKGTSLENVTTLTEIEHTLHLKNPVTSHNLWCGPAGHTSYLHYDPMDGTLVQLVGSKRITMFPPSQLYNLYPFSIWNHFIHGAKRRAVYSQVSLAQPDLQSFPKFPVASSHRIEITLQPGDILFIPAGWWHQVTSVGEGVVCSINRWWNVPLERTITNWSKLRAHIGSLLGAHHTVFDLLEALVMSDQRQQKLRELIQRF
ncbi:MAG: cupin-like domain-containing protein, partial [Cyanobacteria bacterium J06642_11]